MDLLPGNDDPDSPWSQARYNWSRQLLARYGLLADDQFPEEGHPDCSWLDKKKLRDPKYALDIHGVVFFDEVHMKAVIGGKANRDTQTQFKRNEHGFLDENGTFGDPTKVDTWY